MIPEPSNAEALPPRARITILKNATGETRTRVDDWTGDFSKGWSWVPTLANVYWMWTEGNQSCDCNRAMMFGATMDDDIPCCDEDTGGNQYTLVGFEPVTT